MIHQDDGEEMYKNLIMYVGGWQELSSYEMQKLNMQNRRFIWICFTCMHDALQNPLSTEGPHHLLCIDISQYIEVAFGNLFFKFLYGHQEVTDQIYTTFMTTLSRNVLFFGVNMSDLRLPSIFCGNFITTRILPTSRFYLMNSKKEIVFFKLFCFSF